MMEHCGSRPLLQMKKALWGAEEGLQAGAASGVHVGRSTKVSKLGGMKTAVLNLSKNSALGELIFLAMIGERAYHS